VKDPTDPARKRVLRKYGSVPLATEAPERQKRAVELGAKSWARRRHSAETQEDLDPRRTLLAKAFAGDVDAIRDAEALFGKQWRRDQAD
jgi:hypothetical protein